MSDLIDVDTLRSYLAETLPPEEMARVEKALRDSAELRQQLEDVRQLRGDPHLHTLGAIWRRSRLTCPSRQQLGSYLLDALDPAYSDYVTFHLDVIGCAYCQANLADLRARSTPSAPASTTRQRRYFHSSRHLLGNPDG